MRDDIHRRLPLPSGWKRLVKACARDAEATLRPSLLMAAAHTELRHLRPSFVEAMRRALTTNQPGLFPVDMFQPVCTAANTIESSVLRECASIAGAGLAADEALTEAVQCALSDRVSATRREIRAQVSLAAPHDCPELMLRFGEAERAADLPGLVRRHLGGEASARPQRLPLDVDADLRGSP